MHVRVRTCKRMVVRLYGMIISRALASVLFLVHTQ